MLLDSIDGAIARRRHQETIFGAQLDGAVDRLVVVLAVFATVSYRHDQAAVLQGLLVCVQFALIDQLLSNQFLRFGLWSPDHFYAIDETVWRLNWSPLAKLISNLPVLLYVAAPALGWSVLPITVLLIVVRLHTYGRIRVVAASRQTEQRYAIDRAAPDFDQAVARPDGNLGERSPIAAVVELDDASHGYAIAVTDARRARTSSRSSRTELA